MELTQVTSLVLLGILWNLPGSEPCKFGPNCDYPCHCQNNEVCSSTNGSCPSGCDDGDLMDPGDFWYTGAWSGYGCQIGNVAYGKPATQGVGTHEDNVAARAVDGNHDPVIDHSHCAHPFDQVLPYELAWWEVDLGATYVVLAVNITNRVDFCDICRRRTADLNITVSEDGGDESTYDLCDRVGSEGENETLYVECQQSQRGRYVRLQRHADGFQPHFINICEVQVYGYLYSDCPDEYFGVACGTSCNCKEPCDDITGTCFEQVCVGGWRGTNCQTVCSPGTWGSNCVKMCNCMDENEVCDRFEGRCMSGCISRYGGVGCDLVLPGLSSTVEFSDASSSTIAIRFTSWSPDNGNGDVPSGYMIQRRENDTMVWTDALEVNHNVHGTHYSVILDDLQPATVYYIRIIPFIEDAGGSYRGIPTDESGPFATLNFVMDNTSKDNDNTNDIGMIVGVVLAVIAVAVLVVILAVFLRRRSAQRQDNDNELTDLSLANPRVNEPKNAGDSIPNSGVEGYENHTYEEIRSPQPVYQNEDFTNNPHLYENSQQQIPSNRS